MSIFFIQPSGRSSALTAPQAPFSFRLIAQKLSPAWEKRFVAADQMACEDKGAPSEEDVCDFLANGSEVRPRDPVRLGGSNAALAALRQQPRLPLTLALVRRANAQLIGVDGDAESDWRRGPIWIGRVPRSVSVFEAAVPAQVPRLMAVWGKFCHRPAPLSFVLAVASMRLLQIHPFLDGNGRTARWVMLKLCRRRAVAFNAFDALAMRVWARGAAFRHACSSSITEDDDWDPWLEAWTSH